MLSKVCETEYNPQRVNVIPKQTYEQGIESQEEHYSHYNKTPFNL